MFRLNLDELSSGVNIRIEGRLAGDFAEETRELIEMSKLPKEFVVNLSDVTFADSFGENVLRWLKEVGAKFVADTSYSLHLCERLDLPLSEPQPSPM